MEIDPKALLNDPEQRAAVYRQVANAMWQRGLLTHLFHETQAKIYELLQNGSRQFFFLCSRRLGKSYMLVCLAFMQALRKPNSRILFLAPFAKDAADIFGDLAVQILEDCPEHLKPEFKAQTRELIFKNGSIIRFKGVNGEHAQFLRGGAADLIILDECGIMDDLESVYKDVCIPMTATTKGKILFATTPPKSPSHPSVTLYERMAGQGASAKFTLRDAPHIDREEKKNLLIAVGEDSNRVDGILDGTLQAETTTALREFFCEFVTDASSAVLPEYDHVADKEMAIEVPRPDHFDAYVAMDPGMRDRTGLLFGYWDFIKAKLVIEDELLLSHAKTSDIATAIRRKEEELWGMVTPYMRVSDVDLRLIADLKADFGLQFQKTRKDDLLAQVNKVRNDIQARNLIIHPRCKNLRRQMRNAIWNNKATEFARPGDENAVDGHYDLVAALIYLRRNINQTKNPFPATYFMVGGPGGPPVGSWISPRRYKKKGDLGIFPDTPLTRRLVGKK